jgi:hypothetical protein
MILNPLELFNILFYSLTDSPVGLLAYIMEKYSSWSFDFDTEIRGKRDGGLDKFNRDELLTITTLYWMSNSITSSIRLYKYAIEQATPPSDNTSPRNYLPRSVLPKIVEVSYQSLERDLFFFPRSIIELKYPNLKSYKVVKNGGHFAAFDAPKPISESLVQLINRHV